MSVLFKCTGWNKSNIQLCIFVPPCTIFTNFQMETIKDEQRLRKHFDEFFDDTTKRNRNVSRERSRPPLDKSQKDEENVLEQNRFERGTTPGRTLVTNLKPAPRKSDGGLASPRITDLDGLRDAFSDCTPSCNHFSLSSVCLETFRVGW